MTTEPISQRPLDPLASPQATPVRLAYVVSHPIQYQAPLLRRIAQEPGIDLTVFFGADFSVKGYRDAGFGGAEVKWDVPLLGGYRHRFLRPLRDNGSASVFSPISLGMSRALAGFDAVWVHGYSTVNSLHAIVAARAAGVPVLLRAESWLGDRPRTGLKLQGKRLFFEVLKQMVDGVLAIGTQNRRYWERYLGEDFPIFLMPYSVDNAFFAQRSLEAAAGRQELREELELEPGRPVVLFASKLQTRKHCGDLVEAWARLSPDPGVEPHPYLVIVGDGEERAALERQAQATGFENVRFCGFRNQSELPRFFDLCSVFVLPSRHEPWGLIVNEVMNAGRPVIISDDVGCAIDLVRDGQEGYIYPVRDVSALTNCLHRVLSQPETAEDMGQRARERMRTWSFEEDVRGLRQALAHVTRKLSASRMHHAADGGPAVSDPVL